MELSPLMAWINKLVPSIGVILRATVTFSIRPQVLRLRTLRNVLPLFLMPVYSLPGSCLEMSSKILIGMVSKFLVGKVRSILFCLTYSEGTVLKATPSIL